jgi:hypothetical protein
MSAADRFVDATISILQAVLVRRMSNPPHSRKLLSVGLHERGAFSVASSVTEGLAWALESQRFPILC